MNEASGPAEDTADPPSLLVVVMDISPSQRFLADDPSAVTHYVKSIVAFCNTYVLLSARNRMCVLTSHSQGVRMLYPVAKGQEALGRGQDDCQYEEFSLLQRNVMAGVKEILQARTPTIGTDSLLAGALTMALCYTNRITVELGPSGQDLQSRVLVASGSADSAAQYMTYMNCFFSAQKMGVVIDACVLGQHDSGLLQQAADITGGVYLRPPHLQGLLQYLMWVFLPSPSVRQKLVLPPPVKVDYRAACFCHRELIDIGFVCSICLSIFCKFSPICTTCLAVFKSRTPLQMVRPKKKKPKVG